MNVQEPAQEPGPDPGADFSKDQPTQEPSDFESADLGRVVSVHGYSPTGLFGPWGTLAALLGLVVGLQACYQMVTAIKDEGFVAILEGLVTLIVLIPVLFVAALIIGNSILGRKDVLKIYEKGFKLRQIRRREVWRWEDIEEVRHVARLVHDRGGTRYSYTSHAFIIRGGERKPLTTDEETSKERAEEIRYQYHEEFRPLAAGEEVVVIDQETHNVLAAGRRIQEQVVKIRLPETLERLVRGETLSFGPFEINERELGYTKFGYGKSRLQWSEVGSIEEEYLTEGSLVEVKTGIARIVIRKRGESQSWAQVLASKIPNDRLFLSLAHHLMRGRR